MVGGCFYTFTFLILLLPRAFPIEDRKLAFYSYEYVKEKIYTRPKTYIDNLSRSRLSDVPSRSLVGMLYRTIIEFEEIFEKIIQSVTTNVPKISQDTEIFLLKLTNYTRDVVDVLSNKILRTSDILLKELFVQIERQLEAVKVEFQNLATSVDQHFKWAINELNYTLMNNTAEYDWWTANIKHRLRFVNDTRMYKVGCKTIDEFIHRSNIELQNCCKISMKPMQSLCSNATSLLTESMHVIVDNIDRIQNCLENSKSYSDYLVPCITLAYEDIGNILTRVVRVRYLVDNMLPMKILYTRNCFVIVMVDMKHQRNTIESSLFEN